MSAATPAEPGRDRGPAGANGAGGGARTRAIVLHPDIDGPAAAAPRRDPDERLREAVGLAEAIDLDIRHREVARVGRRRAATLFGRGAVERIAGLAAECHAELVVVDGALAPAQQRNLERAWNAKVIDRTALILEIFGARAATAEGRLQVDLAALTFQRTRLVRSWTHLERQRGGAGFLGGPGESQIELDRRLIDDRIGRLKRELGRVARTRGLHRAARRRAPHPVVAFVGYTNAGKSTLFNRLAASGVLARDMLFATLDPTMRRLPLPSGRAAILSDTVGFISDLPTHLVAAFRATLEEVREAEILVHVRDASHPERDRQKADVEKVLEELGVADRAAEGRAIEAFNKIDLLPPAERRALLERPGEARVALSALTGEGCGALLERLDDMLGAADIAATWRLDPAAGAAVAWLHRHGRVVGQEYRDGGLLVSAVLDPADAARFDDRFAAVAARRPAPAANGGAAARKSLALSGPEC